MAPSSGGRKGPVNCGIFASGVMAWLKFRCSSTEPSWHPRDPRDNFQDNPRESRPTHAIANAEPRRIRLRLAGGCPGCPWTIMCGAGGAAVELSATGRGALQHGVDLSALCAFHDGLATASLCRRRESLDFTPGGPQSVDAAPGRRQSRRRRPSGAAVQKAVGLVRRRMGPVIGPTSASPKRTFAISTTSSNYDCWDTTRYNTTSLATGRCRNGACSSITRWGDPHYRGNALVLAGRRTTPRCWSSARRVCEWVRRICGPRGYLELARRHAGRAVGQGRLEPPCAKRRARAAPALAECALSLSEDDVSEDLTPDRVRGLFSG